MRIGYLIPAFPSQTHIFFWREMRELEKLGIQAEVASTQRPDPRLVSHSWAAEAMERTVYLYPPRAGSLLGAAMELLRAGPRGWARCLTSVVRADGCSVRPESSWESIGRETC